ncbi:MAG: hypothetical protein ACXWNC_04495, partial [Anaerolineales bacterium]
MRKRLIKGVLNHHDCRPGGGWEPIGQSYNTGGIWNRVFIEQLGAITITQLLLHADMDSEPSTLLVDLWVRNRSKKRSAQFEVHSDPENFRGKSQTSRFTIELPEGESVQSVQVPVTDVHPWQPWDRGFPHLYKITASLTSGREITSHSSLFGFRTVQVEPGFRWIINGQRYFLRGSNYLPSQWLSETLFKDSTNTKERSFGNIK